MAMNIGPQGDESEIAPELRRRVTEAIVSLEADGRKPTITAVRDWLTKRYGEAGDNGPLTAAVRVIRQELAEAAMDPADPIPERILALSDVLCRQTWVESKRIAVERHEGERQALIADADLANQERESAEGHLTTAHEQIRAIEASLEAARKEAEDARTEAAAAREAQAKAEDQAADERGRVDAALAAAARAQEGAARETEAREAAETRAREAEANARTAEGDRRAAEARAAEQAEAAETRIADLRVEQERRIEDLRQERDAQAAAWESRLRESEAAAERVLKEAKAESVAERERIVADAKLQIDAAEARAAKAEQRLDDLLGRQDGEAAKTPGRGRKGG